MSVLPSLNDENFRSQEDLLNSAGRDEGDLEPSSKEVDQLIIGIKAQVEAKWEQYHANAELIKGKKRAAKERQKILEGLLATKNSLLSRLYNAKTAINKSQLRYWEQEEEHERLSKLLKQKERAAREAHDAMEKMKERIALDRKTRLECIENIRKSYADQAHAQGLTSGRLEESEKKLKIVQSLLTEKQVQSAQVKEDIRTLEQCVNRLTRDIQAAKDRTAAVRLRTKSLEARLEDLNDKLGPRKAALSAMSVQKKEMLIEYQTLRSENQKLQAEVEALLLAKDLDS